MKVYFSMLFFLIKTESMLFLLSITLLLAVLVFYNADKIAYILFDTIMNLYTYCRLQYKSYYPNTSAEKVKNVTLFYYNRESTDKEVIQDVLSSTDRKMLNSYTSYNLTSLLRVSSLEDSKVERVALSINIDTEHGKIRRLINLRDIKDNTELFQRYANVLEFNETHHDYTINVDNKDDDKVSDLTDYNSSIEAYLNGLTMIEVEETLQLLCEIPELMQFDNPTLEQLFLSGKFSYSLSDDLGSLFIIDNKRFRN